MTGTEKLARYSRKTVGQTKAAVAPDAASKTASGKEPYQAYKLSIAEKRYLELRVKFPAPADSPSNAMLTSVAGEWRMGLGVTLKYGNTMVVEISGEGLTELFQAIKEWKVEWLQEFDPTAHEEPTDPNAPFIKSIEITTTRPEPPPPLSQRH